MASSARAEAGRKRCPARSAAPPPRDGGGGGRPSPHLAAAPTSSAEVALPRERLPPPPPPAGRRRADVSGTGRGFHTSLPLYLAAPYCRTEAPAARHGSAGTARSAPALPPGAWGLGGAGRGGLRLLLTFGLLGAGRCGAAFLGLRPVRGPGGGAAAAAGRAGGASVAIGGAGGRRRGLRGSRRRTGGAARSTGRIKAELLS